ncbi:MAG: hypothetical protein GEV07_17955 [Streptosporangiales bacterium]|nr:hypothetical protein [Streptosporangiales bacterium]
MTEQVDVVVLGMGVGGESVADTLAGKGLDVDGMAGHASVTPDWAPVATRIREEATTDWDDRIAVERFTGAGGTFVRGRGRLVGTGKVEVDGVTYEARRGVVIGTGTVPVVPPVDGLADTPYWTNRDAMKATEPPESLLVLGGGAVGLEVAQAFARFGSDVTVVEALDRLLPVEEPEVSHVVRDALERDGIAVRAASRASQVSYDGERFAVKLHDGAVLYAQRLLYRLLVRGEPVPVERLAAETGWDAGQLRGELTRHPGTDWDGDRVAGFNLTLRPTPHRIALDGTTVYAFCATGAMEILIALGRAGTIDSPCAATGTNVCVEITPDGVVVDPPEAVVSKVRPTGELADVRRDVCGLGHFFSSPDAATDWLARNPAGRVDPVADEFEITRRALREVGWAA